MADLGTVESLARLQLAARRSGLHLRLRHVPNELRELITFVGLADLIEMKRAAARPQDLEDVESLRSLREAEERPNG